VGVVGDVEDDLFPSLLEEEVFEDPAFDIVFGLRRAISSGSAVSKLKVVLPTSWSSSASIMTTCLSALRHCFTEFSEESPASIAFLTWSANWLVDRSRHEVSASKSEFFRTGGAALCEELAGCLRMSR